MKKLSALLLALLLTALVSCTSGTQAENLKLPLSVTANLCGSNARFTAKISEQECDIIFDTDHSLAGTELHFGADGNTATAGGFTREVEEGIFPAQESFIKALRAICREDISGTETENGTKYTIDEMTIMVYYDKDTGQLTGIGTEEGGRKFEFEIVALDSDEIQSNGGGQP